MCSRRAAVPPSDSPSAGALPRSAFIHILKTGGTSLTRALHRYFPRAVRYPDPEAEGASAYLDTERLVGMPASRRHRTRLFAGHIPFAATELLDIDLVRFSVLRDPVARTISHLRQFQRDRPDWRDRRLEELYEDPTVFAWFLHEHQTRVFAASPAELQAVLEADRADLTATSQPVSDEQFTTAVENLERLDVVGVTEQLDRFTDALGLRLGLDLGAVGRVNATPAPAEVDPAFAARIRRDNPADVELHDRARRLARR